ncbi:MAG: ABC transporter permease [Planctomycetota bacterium]|nr:ABC transporter permease [Planctomycetota bacterium]
MLLCCRYLRTRYIALASIISVMLGVATMIVVNSVMSGFTTEMRNRIHGILSDVIVESRGMDGFYDPDRHIEQIMAAAGDSIEGMTPTVIVPAMLNFEFRGNNIARQVNLIGIDAQTQSQVSDFEEYLQHPENRKAMSFSLREGGYDVQDHQSGPEAMPRAAMGRAGWEHRRNWAKWQSMRPRSYHAHLHVENKATSNNAAENQTTAAQPPGQLAIQPPPLLPPAEKMAAQNATIQPAAGPTDPFAAGAPQGRVMDPAKEQYEGLVLGFALASIRDDTSTDRFLVMPGDDVKITVPTNGRPPTAVSYDFTIVDLYESKMSEYDSNFVFVPIRKLQELRGMWNYQAGIGWVNSIQIKLKPGADGNEVREKLRKIFPHQLYNVVTWRDKQGPLLAAVQMEIVILNILLFMIIAVAGFGILATFLMIVVEKTRDIGILKSLGASRSGIMGIFLGYGLMLGVVGSGGGMALGLLFVDNLNRIADFVSWATGQPVFDPSIYYFDKIPAIVDPLMIAWVVFGALAIAVLASVLPALRAAMLHPVEALRYE